MDYAELARQTVEFIKPCLVSNGGALVVGVGANALYDWLKRAFTKPAAVGAFAEAVQSPTNELNLEALRLQIRKALEEDETFRKGLLEHLPKDMANSFLQQNAHVAGDNNVTIQNTGSGSTIQVNQPDRPQ
jgi:hypothetical protein